MKNLILLFLIFTIGINTIIAQTWTHDFETSGGYTTSNPECSDGFYDYFTRTDGSNIGNDPTGQQGSYYFAAQDINAGTCPNIGSGIGTITFNDIDISYCTGLSFEVFVAQYGFDGWDPDEYVHFDYDIDNSGSWTNLLWFESDDLAALNQPGAQDTDFDGLGNGTTLGVAFQNFTAAIAGTGSVIDIRVTIKLADGGADVCIDNLRIFGTGCVPPTNTITVNSVSSLSYGVDCTNGASGTVNITSTDVFTAGNTYTVELSNASGSFTSPTTIGSISSTSNGPIDINFTIPEGTATGTGYRIRVISSNPAVTSSDNGSNISITLSGGPCILEPPHLTSVIINSCNATCNEGYNEIVFGTSGDYSFDVNTTDFNFEYGLNPSPSSNTSYSDVLLNNTTRINELNTASTCPGLFIDATGTTIPPNSSWMMAYTDICEEAFDWSALCGSGPIYVIFQDDPSWNNVGGNFVNNNSGMRYLNTRIITTSSDVFDIDYNFDSDTYANSDGVFVQYSSGGGAPTLYGDEDCNLTPVVLPIELYSFIGKIENNESYLQWTTLSEYNFSHFEIFHATDITSFYKIGTVNATGNTNMTQDYRMIHPNPVPGVNYYRLAAVDNDGTSRNHGIIALNFDVHFAYYNGNAIVLNSPYAVEIYNLQGQLILDSSEEVTIPFNHKGVFFIREVNSGTTQKIVIQ